MLSPVSVILSSAFSFTIFESPKGVICTVDTAQSALDLVAAGIGIAFIPDSCVQERGDIRFIPIQNWHQALYMCIYYDKWLEPPVWEFVELLVSAIRDSAEVHSEDI